MVVVLWSTTCVLDLLSIPSRYPLLYLLLSAQHELDTKIAKYLADSPHDLNSFLKISKGYRAVGEPILYETTRIGHSDEVTMRLLLLSLIRRPILAPYQALQCTG
jgi:hypothetical protein